MLFRHFRTLHAQQTHHLPCSIAGLSRNIIILYSHGNIAHPKHYQTLIHPQKGRKSARFCDSATTRHATVHHRRDTAWDLQGYWTHMCSQTLPSFIPGSVAYMENEVRFADRLAPTPYIYCISQNPIHFLYKARGINSTVHSLVNIGGVEYSSFTIHIYYSTCTCCTTLQSTVQYSLP